MNYLIYIEHAAENLQFFLWYRDYIKRFGELPDGERKLAPEWTVEQAEADAQALATQNYTNSTKPVSAETAAVFKGTDFAPPMSSVTEMKGNPFSTPPLTPLKERESFAQSDYGWSDNASSVNGSYKSSYKKQAAGAFEAADLKLQPCEHGDLSFLAFEFKLIDMPVTIQPFREEISRIISTYIADGSPRQLNLSSKERSALMRALAVTTHPSAFREVVHTVEWSLRHQAHPNFIRWAICNGNRPRVTFARGLGLGGIIGGIIAGILITLSNAGRAWRVLAAVGFVIGVSTLIAAWKGMCVVSSPQPVRTYEDPAKHVKVLHGMHHRHLRPWELFAEDDDASSTYEMKKSSFDSFGSNNSYEDEPWIAKYEKRNIIRKVLDREVWIQEPALRQIQDTIFLQAICGSIVISAVCVAIFVALPKGHFY